MAELFASIKNSDIESNGENKKAFIKVLNSVIISSDSIGLTHIYEEDIVAIEANNRKIFEDFFDGKKPKINSELDGFFD